MSRTSYLIAITTDSPDGSHIVADAARAIACDVGWGPASDTSIDAMRVDNVDLQALLAELGSAREYLAGYLLEAGDVHDYQYGRCDTCGQPCDAEGCTVDRTHESAIPG